MTEFPPPTPAATLVIFRRAADGGPPELLMLERAAKMRFAARAMVFPGGRVDPSDHALAEQLQAKGDEPGIDTADMAARIAAIRETLEEVGLVVGVNQAVTADEAKRARQLVIQHETLEPVLDAFGWTLDIGRLVPFARWCPKWERAFDTRFYLTDLGTGAVELSADETESSHLRWASARQTLAWSDEDSVRVIFPTARNLDRLALYADFAEAVAHAEAHPVQTITPRIMDLDGEPHLTIPEGLGYPVTRQPMRTVKRG